MQPPCDVKALYEYRSEHEDDLNFDAEQVIHVHAVEDEEWLNGSYEDSTGKKHVGMFPKSFVELYSNAETKEVGPNESLASLQKQAPSNSTNVAQKASDTLQVQTAEPVIPRAVAVPVESAIVTEQQDTEVPKTTEETDPVSPITNRISQIDLAQAENPKPIGLYLGFLESMNADMLAPVEHAGIPRTMHDQSAEKINHPTVASQEEKRAVLPPVSGATPESQASTGPRSNDKPVKSNAFRDRIAAFNKQEAAPIAPKPMAKPTFAKKPFVAPPPSKDSFVAPPTQAKPKPQSIRDEIITPNVSEVPEPVNLHDPESSKEVETPPKVGSLKDRIAALQAERSQQAAKKAHKDRPAASSAPVDPSGAQDPATSTKTITDTSEAMSVDDHMPQAQEMTQASELLSETTERFEPTLISSPATLHRQDTNRSIESVVLDPQKTGASVQSHTSNVNTQLLPSNVDTFIPPVPTTARHSQFERDAVPSTDSEPTIEVDHRAVAPINLSEASEESPAEIRSQATIPETQADDEEVSEEEVDEEEQRKIALRQRMAKMSGGMGMGMHMALGLGGNGSSRAKPTAKKYASHHEDEEDRQAPIPMPGLPPMAPRRELINPVQNETRSPAIHSDASATSKPDHDVSTTTVEPSSAIPSSHLSGHTSLENTDGAGAEDEDEEDYIDETATTTFNSISGSLDQDEQSEPAQKPPPIPSNRPSMVPERNPPPPIPTSRPSMDIPSSMQSIPDIPQARPYPAEVTSPEALSRAVPQNEPSSRPSVDIPNRPPVPMTIAPQRPALISPVRSPDSPSMTPGGTKRMSYFGMSSSPPPSIPRQSIDSSIREPVDLSRSSLDTLSRTNSARLDPPARPPPPPAAPVSRAPPPPIPGFAPPPPSRAPTAPSRPSVPPPQHPAYSTADAEEYTPAPSLASPLPTSEKQALTPSMATTLENEKAGYEADDDDTDAASMSRPSVSGLDNRGSSMDIGGAPTMSGSQSTLDRSQTMSKKKGIKGLFKRKDKDGKVV